MAHRADVDAADLAQDDSCALVGVVNAIGLSLLLYAAGFAGWWFL